MLCAAEFYDQGLGFTKSHKIKANRMYNRAAAAIFFEQHENCVIIDKTVGGVGGAAADAAAAADAHVNLQKHTLFVCCSKIPEFHSVSSTQRSVGGELNIDSELHVDIPHCLTQLNTEILDLYRCLVAFRTKIRTLSMIKNHQVLMPYISHLTKTRAEHRTFSVAATPQMVCQIAMLICPPYVPDSNLSSSAWTSSNFSTPAADGRVTCNICRKTMNEPFFLRHFARVSEFLICCTQSVAADKYFSALRK
jgi:hypothetical protein